MASTSESGHVNNVANFETLISFCTNYGAAYNPSNANIKLAALTTILTSAQASLAAHKVVFTTLANATNVREIAFSPLRPLCTRIVNALEATQATRQTKDDAQSWNVKIQGRRANRKKGPKPPVEGEAAPKDSSISVSQQGFDNLVDNFAKLIQTISAEPLYKPNEVDLQVATLTTLLADLKTKNKAVIAATPLESNARIARDKALYAEITGLKDTAMITKKYVSSAFGARSPQFKQISSIKFTKGK